MNRLIKFENSNGCAPCTMVQNVLDEHNVEVEKIDPFDNPEKAAHFKIGSVPTLILVDSDGNEIERSVGFKPVEIASLISKL